MIKVKIHQKLLGITNYQAPNNIASNHIKQKWTTLQEEINKSTIIVGNINASLSTEQIRTKIEQRYGRTEQQN